MQAVRLKNERIKLGLKQEEFAKECGVSPKAQFNYEKGIRFPSSEYLEKALNLGVDVLYVLSGNPSTKNIDTEEAFLLDKFRQLAPEQKKMILTFLIGGFGELGKTEKATQTVTGNVENMIAGNMTVNKNFSTDE